MTELFIDPNTQKVELTERNNTPSVLWDNAIQKAVIETKVGPTIASRAYAILHTAMFDAWAAYDPTAIATQLGDTLQRPEVENTSENKIEAMSYAAYQVLKDLFPEQEGIFNELMIALGIDPNNSTTDTNTAAGVGNVTAAALLEFRHQDGSNQLGIDPLGTEGVPYSDISGYQPINSPEAIIDIERWTPEHVSIDDPTSPAQQFLTPHWGDVTTFGTEAVEQLLPPDPEPFLLVEGEVDLQAKTITLADGTVLEINKNLIGTVINPEFIEQAEQIVEFSANLTDEQKIIAEFWENGGGTAYPPGTWMTFGQFVSARDENTIDQDAQLFFALANSQMDAGIATWGVKAAYDYTRPVRAIRELGNLGLIGEFDEELGGYAIEAWGGPEHGTQRILATNFITYQTPGSHPSPPFAEYVSGHSTFSTAGATVLRLFAGEEFGGEITVEVGSSHFEPGTTPVEEITLEWETFQDAADQAGISRLYGGIHFEDGNLNGQAIGLEIGENALQQAQFYINGGIKPDLSTRSFNIIEEPLEYGNNFNVEFEFQNTSVTDVVKTFNRPLAKP